MTDQELMTKVALRGIEKVFNNDLSEEKKQRFSALLHSGNLNDILDACFWHKGQVDELKAEILAEEVT